MTEYIAYPITQPVRAWHYNEGYPLPNWVTDCTIWTNHELYHMRQSGDQLLNKGEWLVKDLDGETIFYTDDEFRKKYKI